MKKKKNTTIKNKDKINCSTKELTDSKFLSLQMDGGNSKPGAVECLH